MHEQSLFSRIRTSLRHYRLWRIGFALVLAINFSNWPDLQAAPPTDEPSPPVINCTRQDEFTLTCTPDDVTVTGAATDRVDAVQSPTAVQPGGTTVLLGSATWLSVHSLFLHDTNNNNYTLYEYSTTSTGPWTKACDDGVSGEQDWRYCSFGGLTAGATYYIRQTYVDPDGITGVNPVVLGPIPMPATVNNAVTLRTITPVVKDTHILVNVDIFGDANMNSQVTVDSAISNSGPWVQKCGPQTSFAPKLCRVHSLTPDTDYYLRVTLSDPDGVNGATPQIIGPVRYTGVANLALNKSVTADPAWGCCTNPAELVNGRIMNVDWTHGYAWTGGTSGYGGGAPGWKQATIDLGATKSINRVDWWTHDAVTVPTTWKIAVSSDGVTFVDVYSNVAPLCRTATTSLYASWVIPNCGHSARFNPVSTRYVRYSFDDTTLLNGMHGWAVELEVFKQKSPTIRVRKYQDNNSDGWRDDGEPWLAGWDFKLYKSNGTLAGTQTTNALGKASFTNLAVGRYTICEEQKAGWYSTQPGAYDTTYDQPCYTFTVTWNSIATVSFGNSTTPPVTSATTHANEDGVVITFLADTDPGMVNEVNEYDPWLDQADELPKLYLPLVRQ